MEIVCWRDERAFEVLHSAWEELHARSHTATIFNSVTFARLWWHHFGTPGALQLWAVWHEGALVGIAPLYETTSASGEPVLRFLGGLDVSDYLDVVTEPGQEAAVVAALLAGWADAPCCCPIELHSLRHASPTREAFLRLAPDVRFAASETWEEVCPVITLPSSWDAYLGQLDSKQRRELRRKLRKAGQEALISWYRVPAAALEEEMAHFFALHARSGADKAAFMTPAMRAFFSDLANAFAARGWLDLCFLLVDGQPAATYMAFLFRNEVLLYNSGFDGEASDALSPGWLLLCYHIEQAIAEGRVRYDFLRGDEEYKYRFGARSEPLYAVRLIEAGRG